MEYERQVRKWGDSLVFAIPSDLAKYIGVEEGTEIIIKDDEGKYGKFISMWKK